MRAMTTVTAPTEQEGMNEDDLHAQISGGRSEQFDWLTENASAETIAQTLTAFANSAGGRLVIGISAADGSITGVRKPSQTIERVLQTALAVQPRLIMPHPKVVPLRGKDVIVISVPAGLPGVYAYGGRYVRRTGEKNHPLSIVELQRLSYERGTFDFETEPVPHATLDDIDWDKVRAYISRLRTGGEHDAERVLLRRGCLARVGDRLVPTYAGILLFSSDPQAFVRSATITAVRFPGEMMSDRFIRADISGTLPEQIDRAETFLLEHLRKEVSIGRGMARSETLEYPLEAARELVVNAVAHRDYSISGDDIHLFLFANRLEVTSPGRLPGPVTLANIRDARFSRNPAIVQVLSDMGYIERLGYGVDRVIALMEEINLPAPEFSESAGSFCVRLHRAPVAQQPISDAVVDKHFRGVPLNPRQEAAVQYLTRDGQAMITNRDLQALFPDVHAETIRRDLSDLVTKDILEKHGQKRGSFYTLKGKSSH
jgi:ATP-dependent DNA helicase RecG